MTEDQNINYLVNKIIVFTDRRGEVLDKGSNPMTAWLNMQFEKDDLFVKMSVNSAAQGNGSSFVEVLQNGKVVLEARGSYTSEAYNVKAEIYKPGDWESKVTL